MALSCHPMKGGRMRKTEEKKDTVEKEFVSFPDIGGTDRKYLSGMGKTSQPV